MSTLLTRRSAGFLGVLGVSHSERAAAETGGRSNSAATVSPWDPLAGLGPARHVAWLFLALNLIVLQWPVLVEDMTFGPARRILPDYFQDYASCKNIFHGLPIYSDHERTARLYLASPPGTRNLVIHVNAHPPTSVLLALPFVWLDFESAFLATNILSLVALAISLRVVMRGLGVAFRPTGYAPAAALAVTCYPVLEHLYQGQLGLYLSALLLGAWACERNGRSHAAGLLIGIAVAIKLFPVVLIAYFAWRRRWDVVTAALTGAALSTAITVCVLGKQAYIDYFLVALPRVSWFRVGWNNASILGFFSRLFDPLPDHPDNLWWKTRALVQSPDLMILGYGVACIVLMASLGWVTFKLENRRERDLGFALAVVCMVLLSPVAWEHYLVLMILPLALVWVELPTVGARLRKATFLAVVALFWTRPRGVHGLFGLEGHTAEPLHAVLFLSTQFYALVALYLLGIGAIERNRRSRRTRHPAIADPPSA